jgi:hypothetical protein
MSSMSKITFILDDEHNIIACPDLIAWAEWCYGEGSEERRRVALTQMTDEIIVSTVFLGTDHSFGHFSPLWFETMVFGADAEDNCLRCATWDEAVAQHEQVVAQVRGEE